ncbi:hypothetical protein WA026_011649, partial [Henosepilachna vigintioctopunctata]
FAVVGPDLARVATGCTRPDNRCSRVARGSQPHLRETPPTTASGRCLRDNIGTTCFFVGAATTKSGRRKREGAPPRIPARLTGRVNDTASWERAKVWHCVAVLSISLAGLKGSHIT